MMFPNTLSVLQWSSIVVLSSKNYGGVHFVKQIFFGDHTPPQNPPKNSSKCLLWLIVCRSYCHCHSLLLTHPPNSLKKRLLKLSANFVCPLSLSTFRTTSHSVHKCIAFVRDSRYCVFLQFSSLLSRLPSCHIFYDLHQDPVLPISQSLTRPECKHYCYVSLYSTIMSTCVI